MAYQLRVLERLEQLLRVWESQMFAFDARYRASTSLGGSVGYPYAGAVKHWREFRSYLLHLLDERSKEPIFFDDKRFFLPEELTESTDRRRLVPMEFFLWSGSSRRVFHLSKDLQALMNATTPGDIRFSDICWPYTGFAIELEHPLRDKENSYDTILVSLVRARGHEQSRGVLMINLLSDKMQTVPAYEQEMISSALKKRQWKKAITRLNAIVEGSQGAPAGRCPFMLDLNELQDARISDSAQSLIQEVTGESYDNDQRVPLWNAALRIVMGLCVYLVSLPRGTPHVSEWRPLVRTRDPRAIIREAQVCQVSSLYHLTAQERELFLSDDGGPEQPAMFVRGTLRRRPGEGHIPNAPRVVLVRPYIRGLDRLPLGALPSGGQTILE